MLRHFVRHLCRRIKRGENLCIFHSSKMVCCKFRATNGQKRSVTEWLVRMQSVESF